MNKIKYQLAIGAVSLLTLAAPLSAVHAATTTAAPVTHTTTQGLTTAQKAKLNGPSWNGQPKRDWDGPDLPPRGSNS